MVWIALGLTAETLTFCTIGFTWFRSMGYTHAEAGAGAVISLFMVLSLTHQLCLFVGSAWPAIILESAGMAAVVIFYRRWLPRLGVAVVSMVDLFRREALSAVTIAVAGVLMVGLMIAGWRSVPALPPGDPWSQLMAGWHLGGRLELAGLAPMPVLNTSALFFHTARFGLGPGACGFGLLAYLAVGASTYALARRYAWPPMALTVSLMVLSMPRLVVLGLYPSTELIHSAAIAFALVLVYRLVEQHQPADLGLWLLCMLFSINADPMSIALVPVMVILLVVVMIRRHGWLQWREMVAPRLPLTALVLLLCLGLAQLPVCLINLAHGHPPFGATVAVENEGIVIALANLVRYFFISVDPTEPIRQTLAWLVGLDLSRLLVGTYNLLVAPIFMLADVKAPFSPVLSGHGQMAFGPFAALLVLPAMIHTLLRGPRRLKALSVAWMGYLYLAALLVRWHPENLTILSPLFAANGFMVAFTLPPWRLRRRGMRLLQADFALLLVWSIVVGGWPSG